MTSLRQLLTDSIQILHSAGVPSPEVDARELVMYALGIDRAALLTRVSEEVSAAEASQIQKLIKQRARRIPLQHLLGEVEWGGIRLKTDSRALVPRPETEVLLELALESVGRGRSNVEKEHYSPLTILDIGTGTGALALGIKKALPDAQVYATELSAQALTLAQENATLNGLEVHFKQGSLFAGLSGPFDLLVSNPPYLPENDRLKADPEVRHDPDLALYSGQDGLALARELVAQAAICLAPAGVLLLELDPRNVHQLAASMQRWQVEVLPDLTERMRFLRATRFMEN